MSTCSFPFDVIVITSPDPDAAPVQTLEPHLPSHVRLLSTTDPFGARCGSGGGTLAALDLCTPGESVLIIHAGGESSRCPTQMVLGKAWTSLPLSLGEEQVEVSNPTVLLVQVLSQVFQNIPQGSLVVAASDCILDLPVTSETLDWKMYENGVLGIAVPAPLHTAKNHGVFCINKEKGVTQFLQKPSPETMRQTPHCVFAVEDRDKERAWIDTGVVAFLAGGAADTMRSLASSMERCTVRGLRRLYENKQHESENESLETFARRHVLRVELYTHIIMAFSCPSFDDYLQMCGSDGSLTRETLQELYTLLSPFSLQAMALPTGSFTHLGTSREMVQFLTQDDNCMLVKRARALVPFDDDSSSVVVANTHIKANTCTIGDGSVLEHVHIAASSEVEIGMECLLSGLRGTCDSLTIPDQMILQMLPLKKEGYVYMYLGLDDGIKSGTTMWGMPMEHVMRRAGLAKSDIWDDDDTTVWKARIHPVVVSETSSFLHDDLFLWITELIQSQDSPHEPLAERAKGSLAKWNNLPRLSVSEIRHEADAVAEFKYRDCLEKRIVLREIVMNRQHNECSIEAFIDSSSFPGTTTCWPDDLKDLTMMFDSVILDAFDEESYDVSGRACMIASELFSKLATSIETVDSLMPSDLEELEGLRVTNRESIETIVNLRNSILSRGATSTRLEACAVAMERCASAMTERCCVVKSTSPAFLPRIEHAPLNTWVVATAPARIDLAGGWSDTPPICVEHGGAVCNIAVTLDGQKPLSCRCRLVSGGSGILLRSEGRDIQMGELTSETTAFLGRVGDLEGYRDPESDCSLIKCALVYCGLVSTEIITECPDNDLSSCLEDFCGIKNVGMEIVTTSLLPHGSGMGTSSILGGCVLSAITQCVGIDTSDTDLVDMVLLLEQLLCTGGGWQDQVGGLIGGAKLCTSKNTLPLQMNVEQIPLSPTFRDTLNARLVLVFTGQTRLAKNILQNVLRHWARRNKEIVETVNQLTTGAKRARDCFVSQDINGLADCLNTYWKQKKIMAGESSEPLVVRTVLEKLLAADLIQAGSLCGAGGGGFMVLLMKDGRKPSEVERYCRDELDDVDTNEFTWHECKLAHEGLSTVLYENGGANAFHMSWHQAS